METEKHHQGKESKCIKLTACHVKNDEHRNHIYINVCEKLSLYLLSLDTELSVTVLYPCPEFFIYELQD